MGRVRRAFLGREAGCAKSQKNMASGKGNTIHSILTAEVGRM